MTAARLLPEWPLWLGFGILIGAAAMLVWITFRSPQPLAAEEDEEEEVGP